uniref:Uncharacterized protein n=1 Tax=Ixodes ricinus TaxID=34613 RepID=V5H7U4_IXORI
MLLHFLLSLVMCAKLVEDVLDRLDIFILELEELYIPKPLLWEWVWLSSIVLVLPGLTAVRRNRPGSMKFYAGGTFFLGLCPVLFAAVYFFREMYAYVQHGRRGQGHPVVAGVPRRGPLVCLPGGLLPGPPLLTLLRRQAHPGVAARRCGEKGQVGVPRRANLFLCGLFLRAMFLEKGRESVLVLRGGSSLRFPGSRRDTSCCNRLICGPFDALLGKHFPPPTLP